MVDIGSERGLGVIEMLVFKNSSRINAQVLLGNPWETLTN